MFNEVINQFTGKVGFFTELTLTFCYNMSRPLLVVRKNTFQFNLATPSHNKGHLGALYILR